MGIAVGVAYAVVVMTFSPVGAAQTSTEDSGRKVKIRVRPQYPDLARRTNISGKVRVEVVVALDGRVKSTRVLGGHPLLAQACETALKSWRFVPASEETTQVIEFNFTGDGN